MSQTERLERDLTAWFFETAAPRTPEYTDDLLAQAAGVRQRPAWTFPERWLPMSVTTLGQRIPRPIPWRSIGLLALLGLIILLAVAAYIGANRRPLPAPFGVAGNGVVAFTDRGDIVAVDPVTGSRTVVIGGLAAESAPVFSRDGTRLAYVRETGGARSLWVAEADGSQQRQLSTDALVDFDGAAWSPDGGSILTSTDVGGVTSMAIVPTDGGHARILDVGMVAEGPKWRPPDGNEILFRGTTPTGFGLFAVTPDDANVRPVTPADGVNVYDYLYYDWSPDGSQIAYQRAETLAPCPVAVQCGQHLYVIGADGAGMRELTSAEAVNVYWSPDGTKVAFWDMGLVDGGRLAIVPIDGSGPVSTDLVGASFGIAWTPDSSGLLYLADGSDSPLLVDPAGGPTLPTAWRASTFPDWQRVALP